MLILIRVTCVARGRRVDVDMRVVACAAFGIGVPAKQGETRQVVIEEEILRPVDFGVTVVASESLSAVVRVVLDMTSVTVVAQSDLEYRLDVAEFAIEHGMRSVKRMTGIEGMIEGNRGPLRRRMTAGTADSEMPDVLVII